MADINDLTIVDASNTARFPENQAPSTVNDGARALEGIIARWHKDLNGSVLTTGTSTAYVYAANQTLSAYYDGMMLGVDFHTACGASPTINVDAIGAISLVWPDGTALAANDIPTGAKAIIVYDGTNFQVNMDRPSSQTGFTSTELVRKATTETVNNSTTLQNDDELLASLAANEIVFFEVRLRINSSPTPDIKFAFTVPTGATLGWGEYSTGTSPEESTSGDPQVFTTSGSDEMLQLSGYVANGANTGNLQLQWAQQTANASDTNVYANSIMLVWRV